MNDYINMENHYIYKITNLINGKNYIGQRICPENKIPETDTKYMGSGIKIKNAEKKYGLDNFEKTILIKDIQDKNKINYHLHDLSSLSFQLRKQLQHKVQPHLLTI